MAEFRATERTPDRRYFTIVPNVVMDKGLSAYALALYLALKRVAGEDGYCSKSTRTLAQETGMSVYSVSNAKRALESAGLIRVYQESNDKGAPRHVIRIEDIWQENVAAFAPPADAEPSADRPKRANVPEGVAVFREITRRYPRKEHYETVHNLLSGPIERELAELAWQEWTARGYNPQSIKWLTDWFAEGEIPEQTQARRSVDQKNGGETLTAAEFRAAVGREPTEEEVAEYRAAGVWRET